MFIATFAEASKLLGYSSPSTLYKLRKEDIFLSFKENLTKSYFSYFLYSPAGFYKRILEVRSIKSYKDSWDDFEEYGPIKYF